MPVLHRLDWAVIGALALVVVLWGVHEWGVSRGERLERVKWQGEELEAASDGREAERELVARQITELGAFHERVRKSVEESRVQAAELRRVVDAWAVRPVPGDIVRLLDPVERRASAADPAGAVGGPGARADDSLPGPSDGGAVPAGVLAAAVEENGERCQRNIERLELCRAMYEEARQALIRFQRGDR